MAGKGINSSPDGVTIKLNGNAINSLTEKTELFLQQFSCANPSNILLNAHFEATINERISSPTPNIHNDPISAEEITKCLPKSKSKAVGMDLVDNRMVKNLSAENQDCLRHLFDTLLKNAFVPTEWKQATVIPLLKPGKPAEDPTSYRPISITSCLCKAMKRILAKRIHWFLESKGLLNREQVSFRRDCSTLDHIIQLETDIKQS